MIDRATIERLLEPHGLVIIAVLKELVLIGNAGSSIWHAFEASPEFADGRPDPMDRWSRRIGLAVAAELDAQAVFPFEGPPYPPFLEWAKSAGSAFPSPIAMFIHPDYGLWHAYRFALRLNVPFSDQPPADPARSPCLSCRDQPCLSACPVDAFSEASYHVDRCVGFLHADDTSDCTRRGCAARRACPVAKPFHYLPAQARFHMEAFLRAQRKTRR